MSNLLFEYMFTPTDDDTTEVIGVHSEDEEGLRLAADRAMGSMTNGDEFLIIYRPMAPITVFSSDGTAVRFGVDGDIRF